MNPSRSLLVIAGGIAGLVVLAAAVVLLRDDGPPEFAPDSPQAALQAYLAAWESGDPEAPWAWFSKRVHAATPYAEFEPMAREFLDYGLPPNGPQRRVFIDEVTGSGDRVVLHLTVEERYGEGLGASSYRSTRSMPMVRDAISHESNQWRIDQLFLYLDPMEAPYPY